MHKCAYSYLRIKDGAIPVVLSLKNITAKSSNTGKTTSSKAAKAASKVLQDDRTGKDSKTAAGSALSQKEKKK